LRYIAKEIRENTEETMARDDVRKLPAESKRERFVRLAESRTSNAIRAIRTIGKLGNKAQYDFDESDIRKITGALTKEIDAMKARMADRGAKDVVEFKL
jgi:hypothetical protein